MLCLLAAFLGLTHRDPVERVWWSADGGRLLTQAGDGRKAWSPEGKFVGAATEAAPPPVRVSMDTDNAYAVIQVGDAAPWRAFAYEHTPNNATFVGAGYGRRSDRAYILLRDIDSKKPAYRHYLYSLGRGDKKARPEGEFGAPHPYPQQEEAQLFVTADERAYAIYPENGKAMLQAIPAKDPPAPKALDDPYSGTTYTTSDDGSLLLSVRRTEAGTYKWRAYRARDGLLLLTMQAPVKKARPMAAFALSPDGERLAGVRLNGEPQALATYRAWTLPMQADAPPTLLADPNLNEDDATILLDSLRRKREAEEAKMPTEAQAFAVYGDEGDLVKSYDLTFPEGEKEFQLNLGEGRPGTAYSAMCVLDCQGDDATVIARVLAPGTDKPSYDFQPMRSEAGVPLRGGKTAVGVRFAWTASMAESGIGLVVQHGGHACKARLKFYRVRQ